MSGSTKRAPFQVLVIPFLRQAGTLRFAVFQRADAGYWQWIAGGGEGGETPFQAAQREAQEEAAIDASHTVVRLDSLATIPVAGIAGLLLWGEDTLVIPEYSFGVELFHEQLRLSPEHLAYAWLDYAEAMARLKWDSNRSALWELNHRLLHGR